MKALKKLAGFSPIVSFLALEVVAMVSFSLGNSIVLYGILGLVLMILILLTSLSDIRKNGITNAAFFIFPAFIFSLLCCLSGFVTSISTDWASVIFTPVAVLSFAFAGYYISMNSSFSFGKLMMVIYTALFASTLISLVLTLIDYVPFYTLLYTNAYVYYDGAVSPLPVGSMASALYGLSAADVTVEYLAFAPVLLSTCSVALFFLNPKKEKRVFAVYSLYAFTAFLTLLFTVTRMMLIMDVLVLLVVGLFALFGKKGWSLSRIRVPFYVFLGLVVLAFLLVFLNAQEWPFLASFRSFVSGNSFLDRLLNTNKYVSQYNPVLANLFTKDGWLGTYVSYGFAYKSSYEFTYLYPTNVFFIDALMGGGIFGTLFLAVSLVLAYRYLFVFYNRSAEPLRNRSIVVVFSLVTLLYFSFFYSSKPLVFDDSAYVPFFQSPYFLILMFVLGSTFFRAEKLLPEKETKKPENQEEKA